MPTPRLELLAFIITFLTLASAARGQEVPAEHWENSAYGFAIERPARDWRFHEQGAAGDFKLSVVLEEAGGSVGQAVEVKPTSTTVASELVDTTRAYVEERAEYSQVEPFEDEVAGREVPGLRVHYESAGVTYVIEARFLLENGRLYKLECWAPLPEFEDHESAFAAIRGTFRLIDLDPKQVELARLRALAARCGSEVDWAEDWKAAAKRARREEKPVLVFVWTYPGFEFSNTGLTETFMEPEILALIAARYVPLYWKVGQPAPFASQERYGLSGTTFGSALLVVSEDGEVLRQTAALHPARALRFLDAALEGLPDPQEGAAEPRAAGGLVELRHLVHVGRDEEARALIDSLLDAAQPGPNENEALYWRGALHAAAGDLRAARESWDMLIEGHPEDRWAWKAAAVLCSTTVELGSPHISRWPDDEALRPLRDVAPAPLAASHAERVEAQALEWLLREQREDGSWPGTRDLFGLLEGPDPFVDATAAIAGLALLDRREDPEVASALERTLGHVLDSIDTARAREDIILYMDYTVWSRAWMLWFLSDCLSSDLGEHERIGETAAWLARSLASKQRSNGGWSYYHSSTADGSGAVAEQSISFVTAGVIHALLVAQAAGVEVPGGMCERGLDVLEAMRNDDGTFDYMQHVGGRASGGGQVPGAAGRSPLCELALLRAGRSDEQRVAAAIEQFLEHCEELSRELGKVLMHAGAQGQGCHYLMFDYAFAALALKELPASGQREARARVLELIFEARSEEGSFQDTPINGWSYGTAMALFALGRSSSS